MNSSNLQNSSPDQARNEAFIGTDASDQHDIIGFENLGVQPTEAKDAPITSKIQAAVKSGNMHDISHFVSRMTRIQPMPIKTGSYFQINLSTALSGNFNFQKLIGLGVLNFKIHLRLVLNSDPKQNGFILLSYKPDHVENANDDTPWKNLFFRACHATGRHHVLANLAETSVLDLIIPLRVPGIGLIDWQAGIAEVYGIDVLGATNEQTVNAYLYLALEDLDVQGVSTLRFQSEQELNDNTDMTPSRVLEVGSDVSLGLTRIPIIGQYADTAAWLMRGAASVFKSIGLSKPSAPEHPQPIIQQPFYHFAHCNGSGLETRFSVNVDQGISIVPCGVTDEDEMDISYVASRPVLFRRVMWQFNQTFHTSVYSETVTLVDLRSSETVTTPRPGIVHYNTYLSYLASLFQLWRGTLIFTFHFGTNHFHSGRLRFVWSPLRESVGSGEGDVLYSEIFDIRAGSVFSVQVPFITDKTWLNVSDTFGTAKLFVETPLLGSEVSSSVPILVSVSAGKDFAVSVPYTALVGLASDISPLPTPPTRPQTLQPETFKKTSLRVKPHVRPEIPERLLQAQGRELGSTTEPGSAFVFGSLSNPVAAHQLSVGDPVMSLRALAKRYSINSTLSAVNPQFVTILDPFRIQAANVPFREFSFVDYYDAIRAMYAFWTGGVRLTVTGLLEQGAEIPETGIVKLVHEGDIGGIQSTDLKSGGVLVGKAITNFERLRSSVDIPYNIQRTGALMVEMPFYHNRPRCPWIRHDDTTFEASHPFSPLYVLAFQNDVPTTKLKVTCYRSAADDFNCGFLMGPPPTFA